MRSDVQGFHNAQNKGSLFYNNSRRTGNYLGDLVATSPSQPSPIRAEQSRATFIIRYGNDGIIER
jgi:hypothetical protein